MEIKLRRKNGSSPNQLWYLDGILASSLTCRTRSTTTYWPHHTCHHGYLVLDAYARACVRGCSEHISLRHPSITVRGPLAVSWERYNTKAMGSIYLSRHLQADPGRGRYSLRFEENASESLQSSSCLLVMVAGQLSPSWGNHRVVGLMWYARQAVLDGCRGNCVVPLNRMSTFTTFK